MKILDGPPEVDLLPTHFRCVEEDQTFPLDPELDDPSAVSLSDLECPNDDGDEDHAIEFIHESDKPVASTDAATRRNGVWYHISEVDADNWHYGRRVFAYVLVED